MDSPADLVAKKLAWDLESRKSVEVRVRYEITNHEADAKSTPAFNTVVEHYIETATGRRFGELRAIKSGTVTARFSHYADGSKFADVNYIPDNPDVQSAVMIKRHYFTEERSDRKQIPQPLLFLYVGREPLHEALPKAQFLGKGEVIGRECNAFLFPQVRWDVPQDQVFFLDQATSIPLKVEAYRDAASRAQKEPMWVWTARSLDEVQGHFLPLKSTETAYGEDRNSAFTWDYTVDSIEFDKVYPAKTFWPTIQPGVTVFNEITAKVSEAPGARKATTNAKKDVATSAPPIRATPPSDWSSLASTTVLGLGCAVLLAGCVLWWQRR